MATDALILFSYVFHTFWYINILLFYSGKTKQKKKTAAKKKKNRDKKKRSWSGYIFFRDRLWSLSPPSLPPFYILLHLRCPSRGKRNGCNIDIYTILYTIDIYLSIDAHRKPRPPAAQHSTLDCKRERKKKKSFYTYHIPYTLVSSSKHIFLLLFFFLTSFGAGENNKKVRWWTTFFF
jgi:hypothetical protein